jgi:hypothetical protein
MEEISKTIQAGRRLGDTWSKMLMVWSLVLLVEIMGQIMGKTRKT